MSFEEIKKYLIGNTKNNKALIKNKNQKFGPIKNTVVMLVVAGMVFTLSACNNVNIKDDCVVKIDKQYDSLYKEDSKTTESSITRKNTYIDRFNGEYYLFANQDYVYSLSNKALKDIENLLEKVDGITPVGTKTGDFYPGYFNADMFSAIAYTESTFRIEKADGSPMVSHTGAVGMCQIEPIAVNTINKWLKDTMGIDKSYSLEDANDPQKALELSILYNIRNCKNKAKEGKAIYNQMGVEFSFEMQEKLLYAMYFYGEGNVENSAINGTIMDTYLNSNWKDNNGNNYVYDTLRNKEYLINRKTKNIESDYSR